MKIFPFLISLILKRQFKIVDFPDPDLLLYTFEKLIYISKLHFSFFYE